ncbi:MAG TPA: lytic transglycosylase domain-containing protein [Chloroflexota bacterium]|nr:lytic transglycosylase domain-containing protein [Chloroflexota bacterium]
MRNLLGPLLGQPPAVGAPVQQTQPGQLGQSGQPIQPGPPLASGPTAPRIPFCGAVEQWRPLVREALADAAAEGRLAGAAGALDDDLLLALILRESTGDPRALNTGGAEEVGLLQLLPTTFAEQLGRSPTDPTLLQSMQDPRSNLRAGVRYLARAFISQAGDLYWSLVAYRAGLEGANTYRRAGGTPIEIDARIRATLETYARHRPDVRLVFVPSPGAPAPSTVRPVLPAGSC